MELADDEKQAWRPPPTTERLTGEERDAWANFVSSDKRCQCAPESTLTRVAQRGGQPCAESFSCSVCRTRYEALPPFSTAADGPPGHLRALASEAELFDASML